MISMWTNHVVNRPTQLLNCQIDSIYIDSCQMLKYQSSQNHKYTYCHELHDQNDKPNVITDI